MRGQRPTAGHLAQHDAAAFERAGQLVHCGLNRALARLQRVRQLLERDRLGREEEKRLDLARERAHATALPLRASARIVIGPNGSGCSHAASPRL